MCGIHGVLDPSSCLDDAATWLRTSPRPRMEQALRDFPPVLREMVDPSAAWQRFHGHQRGADRSDQLFRRLVLSRRRREVQTD